jgi:hypothetical protein
VVESSITLTNINIGSSGLTTQESELLINATANILHFTTQSQKDSIAISFVSTMAKSNHPESNQKQVSQGEQELVKGSAKLQAQEVVVTVSITMDLVNFPTYSGSVDSAYNAATILLSQTSAFTQELQNEAAANNVASFSTASVMSVASSLSSVQYPPTNSPTKKPGLNDEIKAFFTPTVIVIFVVVGAAVCCLCAVSGIYICCRRRSENYREYDENGMWIGPSRVGANSTGFDGGTDDVEGVGTGNLSIEMVPTVVARIDQDLKTASAPPMMEEDGHPSVPLPQATFVVAAPVTVIAASDVYNMTV